MEDSLGNRLKQAREARGMSLGEIATSTKIAVAALEAIERNDVRRLPGGIFGRAMVRSYALAVGVDADAAVRDLQSEIVRAEREHALTRKAPEISSEDRRFLERQQRALLVLRIVVIAAVVAAVVLAGWFVWTTRSSGG